jgi:DNA-binding XRE family transcriptional regulator
MNFGKWIKQQREFSQLDGYRLAFKSGLTQSTISRIENEKIEPALETAYQLASVFNFNGRQIYRILTIDENHGYGLDVRSFFQNNDNKPSDKLNQPEKAYEISGVFEFPTITDLENIKELSKQNLALVERKFSELVNKINEKLVNRDTEKTKELLNTVYNPKIFFSNLPLSTSHLDYPKQENEQVFHEIIARNGVVIIDDFYNFFEIKLKLLKSTELDFNDKTLIERLESMSSTKDSLGKIKISTIFKWDQILSCNGDLFDLAWKTVEYDSSRKKEDRPQFEVDPEKVSYSFLVLSRWLAALSIKAAWLSDLKYI